jgi:S1-C subfamily serine protease
MSESLSLLSNQLAEITDRVARSVVQVQGRRRPVSGTVYGDELVVTTARALGREDSVRVRAADGTELEAHLHGWDPATHLAVVRVPGLHAPAAVVATSAARVGHLALAVGRSWSNAVTASFGVVAVIGGPLPTGRRLAIPEVIRTTAPMHDGFSGGAFIDVEGRLAGITTGVAIRGLTVVIPAAIAWSAAGHVVEHGTRKRGYLGLAGQPVELPEHQRTSGHSKGLLIVSVSAGGPAERAGVLVGDVLVQFQGRSVESPEDLLENLATATVGSSASARVVRGGAIHDCTITIGARES